MFSLQATPEKLQLSIVFSLVPVENKNITGHRSGFDFEASSERELT